MDVKYGLLLRKSWNDLKNNFIIFLPIVFAILFTLGLFLVIGLQLFLSIKLGLNLKHPTINFMIIGIIFIIVDLLLLILIASAVSGMNFGLLKNIATKKKASSKDMWFGFRNYTFTYFKILLIKILIILIPIILLSLLVILAFLINKTFGIILAVIFVLILILYIITIILIFVFGLFFLNPIITENKSRSAIVLIKQSFKYTKENLAHVLITWLIIVAINIILSVVSNIFLMLGGLLILLFIVPMIIFVIASIIIGAWLKIFLFNSYFNKNLKK